MANNSVDSLNFMVSNVVMFERLHDNESSSDSSSDINAISRGRRSTTKTNFSFLSWDQDISGTWFELKLLSSSTSVMPRIYFRSIY